MTASKISPWLTKRRTFVGIFALAMTIGLVSLVMTHALQLHPCPLCILQRFLILLTALIAFLGVIETQKNPSPKRYWVLCSILVLTLLGLILALYQSQLQNQALQEASKQCKIATNFYEDFAYWLSDSWPFLFKVSGGCASKEWTFMGLSLANWSALVFLGLVSWSLAALIARKRAKAG